MIILYYLLLLKDHVELMVAVAIVLPLWVVVRSSFATSPTKTYLVVMELEQDSPDSSSHSRRLWRGCYFYNRWHLLQMQRADLSTPLVGSCTAHAPALQKVTILPPDLHPTTSFVLLRVVFLNILLSYARAPRLCVNLGPHALCASGNCLNLFCIKLAQMNLRCRRNRGIASDWDYKVLSAFSKLLLLADMPLQLLC